MASGLLTIDLDALKRNWQALDKLSGPGTQTGACVKADGYGLSAAKVAPALAEAGARQFFVAVAEEGIALRTILGPGPKIGVFGGHMAGDAAAIRDADLIPMLNSPEQLARHFEALPGHGFGIQLNSGMNRLGFEAVDWQEVRERALAAGPQLIMSHLACADEPEHAQNAAQLSAFEAMTDGLDVPRSLSATGGILLGAPYHFDMVRPGIGLYGGRPFLDAAPVVTLSLPVIQTREVAAGDPVGYGCTWTAPRPSRIATVAAGYADGLLRSMGSKAILWHGDTACPLAGRVSMDLLTVDVTDLSEEPEMLDIVNPSHGIDLLGDFASTIGYELLTSLGHRYRRRYIG